MVNRGRPSKDCLPCRQRKLRCDLGKDSCGQCKRAGLSCFGYRDPKDLVFRDQTQMIKQKVPVFQEQSCFQGEIVQYTKPTDFSITQSPQLAWDVRARHDFFAHYVFGVSRSYDILDTIYPKSRPGDHLTTSVDAVSLAFLASRDPNSAPKLLQQAAQHYVVALRRVNETLSSPELATADSTLQSVLLLDLYEKMVSRNLQSRATWTGHVFGALALVKMRGHDNMMQSYVGRRLATRIHLTLLISCMIVGRRVPEGIRELQKSLNCFQDKDDAKWQVTMLNTQMVDFRADVLEGRYTSDSEIVAEAKQLDALYQGVVDSFSPTWQPTDIVFVNDGGTGDSRLVYGNHYNIFKDLFVTQGRNSIRIIRLHLHLLIHKLSLCDEVDDSYNHTAESTRAFIEKYAQEICASAPQFVLLGARPENSVPFTPIQALQCHTLLAPLYLAGHASANPELRRWVVNIMRYMAEEGGMKVALRTAEMLELHPEKEFWDVYAMLGGYAFSS